MAFDFNQWWAKLQELYPNAEILDVSMAKRAIKLRIPFLDLVVYFKRVLRDGGVPDAKVGIKPCSNEIPNSQCIIVNSFSNNLTDLRKYFPDVMLTQKELEEDRMLYIAKIPKDTFSAYVENAWRQSVKGMHIGLGFKTYKQVEYLYITLYLGEPPKETIDKVQTDEVSSDE